MRRVKPLEPRLQGHRGRTIMMNCKYYIGEREYTNDGLSMKVIRECKDWSEAYSQIDAFAKQWAADGLIVDKYDDGNAVASHNPENYDLVHDYQVCAEYIPEKGAINPSIKGFEYVKDVVFAGGSERTACDLLFVVRRNSEDYLRGLCEVAENTGFEAYKALEAKYPSADYIIWDGCVRNMPKGSVRMPEGGDIIDFYWS